MLLVRSKVVTGLVLALAAAPLGISSSSNADTVKSSKELADKDISAAVERELIVDSAVPHNDIEVKTEGGIVTLTGTATNLLARDTAQRIASTIRGVRSVVNRIQINPIWKKTDEQIRKDVELALAYDPAADSYELNVEVKQGVVTLKGQVQSFAERDVADKVARAVRGVRDVQNTIAVAYKQTRQDGEIKNDVDARLRWDAYVGHGLISSTVKEGKVELSGSVGSDAERARAYVDAWVAGTKSVDINKLKVEPWLSDQHKSPRRPASDTDIARALSASLLYDPRVSSFNVIPEVKNGVVTLRGTVSSLKAKRAALEDARATSSVVRVIDRLHVRATPQSDQQIAESIRQAFGRDPWVERFEVLTSVHDGVVYLKGTVDSYWEKMRADQIASTALGVKDVRNHLTVYDDRSPLVYEPRVYDFYPYEYLWFATAPITYRSDAEIQDDIADELYWSPFVDSGQVKVKVKAGVATLDGKVDSYSEMYSALENAYEGGAVAVRNNLKVD